MTVKDGLVLGRSIWRWESRKSKALGNTIPERDCCNNVANSFHRPTLHTGFMGNNDTVLPDLSMGLKTSRIKNQR